MENKDLDKTDECKVISFKDRMKEKQKLEEREIIEDILKNSKTF